MTALQMFRMDKVQSEEFLEVYKGVVAEYPVSPFIGFYLLLILLFVAGIVMTNN